MRRRFILDRYHREPRGETHSKLAGQTSLLFGMIGVLVSLLILGCGGGESAKQQEEDGPSFLFTGPQMLAIQRLNSRTPLIQYRDGTFLLDPAVSPDGKTFAFASQPPATRGTTGEVDFGSDILLSDSDGKNVRTVLEHETIGEFIRNPLFLDANTLIINVRGRGPDGTADFRLERLDLQSGQRTRLADNAISPALSPNGRYLAYVHIQPNTLAESLLVTDLQTGEQRAFVPETSPLVLMQNLEWSPDGKILAFMSSDLSSALAAPDALPHPTLQDLWFVNADGTALRRVIELIENSPSPTWSADGSQVYIMAAGGFWRFDIPTATLEELGPGVSGGQIRRLR